MDGIAKQVIVIRKKFPINGELRKLRTGKMCSQASHSSLKAILDLMVKVPAENEYVLYVKDGSALESWLTGSFTKICVGVETEEELLAVYEKAKEAGLITALITDSGRTEFNGVPTKTCCSILGWSDEVDEITGKLELF
jgi:PTH2 family peptidyl-tRNA hydrolase